MTARTAAALSSAALVLVVSGCTSFYEIPIETPIQPKMDVTPFQRVFIAGFIAGGSEDVDANLETVRLLRSQLRSKSPLRVIEADVLPLVDLAREQAAPEGGAVPSLPPQGPPQAPAAPTGERAPAGGTDSAAPAEPTAGGAAGKAAPAPGSATGGSAPAASAPSGGATAGAATQRTARSASSGEDRAAADPQQTGRIRDEKDLEPLEGIFANVDYWKKLGEEYQNPLIVTGTVLFTPHARSGFVQREQEYYDSFGRRRVVPVRTYMERKGFILRPKFIFIDGRTGTTIYSESFREEVLYSPQQSTPALSSYFELMDRLIPSFLSTLSTQKIKGSRILLK
ncbi:MAG TPA: hypothetical protein VE505_20955 [Vicinamibacterales bacterium]|nr:hypothetical protein [Vicinamibacterales bacterium]